MTRRYVSATRLADLETRLSTRDREVLATLRTVRLATGRQLERLHFGASDSRQCRRVLASLVDRGLIARLPRRVGGVRAGSAGYVYALDVAGQRLTTPPGSRRPQRPWTPGQIFLAHTLLVTELFVLLSTAHQEEIVRLLTFEGEPSCWRTFAGRGGGRAVVKTDAYLRLGVGGYEDRWFVEVDRGTESSATITRKADTYRAYWSSGREQARSGGVFPRVLFLVPDEARHQQVVDTLGRQPAESWALYQVALFDQALATFTAGATA